MRKIPSGGHASTSQNGRRQLKYSGALSFANEPAGDPYVATFSLAAVDRNTGDVGVAVASKFLAVGSIVPWTEPGAGALATQALANATYGRRGLRLLRDGLSAEPALE